MGTMKRTTTATWREKEQYWRIQVRKDGKRRTFYSSTPGRSGMRDCHKKADAWLDENIENGNTKVSVLFDKWIEELKVSTGTGNWIKNESVGRLYVKHEIGNKKLSSVNEQHLQDVILYAHRTGNNKKGLAYKSLKNIRDCLSSFIKYSRKCKATNLFVENLTIPSTAKKGIKSILQPRDLEILFKKGKTTFRNQEIDEWYIHAYRFEVVTGLRPGELVGLTNNDINSNILTIHGAINSLNEKTDGKNKNALRSFILPKLAVKILEDQKRMLQKAGVISPYIFPAPDSNAVPQRRYYICWVRYRKNAGMSKTSPYELRHTFFSANKQVPKELLKPGGGHGKDFDTFGVYGHVMEGEAQRAADLINKTFETLIAKSGFME